MITVGKHRAKVESIGVGRAGTGTEQVEAVLRVEDERITWFGYLSDRALVRTIESLRAMGWQGDDISDLRSCEGNECEIVVEDEDGRLRVRWVNALSSGPRNPLTARDLRELAARLRPAVAAADAALAQKRAARRQTQTPHERAKASGYSPDPEATAPFDGSDDGPPF